MAFDAAALSAKAEQIRKKEAEINQMRADHLGLSMKNILAQQRGTPADRAAAKAALRDYDRQFGTATSELAALESEMATGHAELMASIETRKAVERVVATRSTLSPREMFAAVHPGKKYDAVAAAVFGPPTYKRPDYDSR